MDGHHQRQTSPLPYDQRSLSRTHAGRWRRLDRDDLLARAIYALGLDQLRERAAGNSRPGPRRSANAQPVSTALDYRFRHIMETRTLKHTDLTVSRACFGTMTFGSQVDEATAARMIDLSIERGVNFCDTANVYNKG